MKLFLDSEFLFKCKYWRKRCNFLSRCYFWVLGTLCRKIRFYLHCQRPPASLGTFFFIEAWVLVVFKCFDRWRSALCRLMDLPAFVLFCSDSHVQERVLSRAALCTSFSSFSFCSFPDVLMLAVSRQSLLGTRLCISPQSSSGASAEMYRSPAWKMVMPWTQVRGVGEETHREKWLDYKRKAFIYITNDQKWHVLKNMDLRVWEFVSLLNRCLVQQPNTHMVNVIFC